MPTLKPRLWCVETIVKPDAWSLKSLSCKSLSLFGQICLFKDISPQSTSTSSIILCKINVGGWTSPQRWEECFGIQPTYQSYCRASGNSHIPLNTCEINRARAPGHQPSQILSHTEQYHPLHSDYWLRGRKWCILTFHLCLADSADSADKSTKPLPAAPPRENIPLKIILQQICFFKSPLSPQQGIMTTSK